MLTLNDGRSELWQWDTGRKLTVDADCSQVHFSNKVFGRSIDVDVMDGLAIIPDILLQTDKELTAWAFVGTTENGYTKISKVFKVNKRNKPADYVFTPPDQTSLEEIKERLENLESIQDPDAIKNAVEDYLEQNPVEAPVKSVNGKTGTVKLTADDVGAISQDKLQEATNEALAQAKASGEFDGKDGATFTPSLDDEGNLSWSNDKGLPNPETKNIRGPQGPAGEVSDDKIAEAVKEYLDSGQNPTGGTGLTATEKNLMLTLFKAMPYQSDMSATMKSLEAIWTSNSGEDSDGDTPDTPDVPAVTYYSVAYNLTNITADNSASSIVEGGSLTVNLTPDTNAVMSEVVVTMGGVDVTATAYSNGKISISSVTGNVVITATATVANYTQVEYLESATKDAYIITNYTLKPTDLVECEWAGPPSTIWAFPFSGCTKSGAMCKLRTRTDATAGRTSYTRRGSGDHTVFNDADPNFAAPRDNTTFLKFVESAPGTGAIYDTQGNVLCTLTDDSVETFPDTGCVMGLFIPIVGGTKYGNAGDAGMRIKYFKIKNAYGDAVLDLIPVLDENNVACMYDKVSGEYLYNACTNEGSAFIAGGVV